MNEVSKTDHESRRKYERVWFKYQAVLEITDGKTFWGISRDVSLRGLFLVTTGVPIGVAVGNTGVLRLTVLNVKKEFPCRVAHVGSNGLGIELFDKGESFGAVLTASLLQDTQIRLGADVDANDLLKVVVRRAPIMPSLKGGGETRLLKISSGNMEFIYSLLFGWSFKAGDALQLEIQQSPQDPIVVEGVVRTILSKDSRIFDQVNDRICAVVFSVLPDRVSNAIRELVGRIHSRRLQKMMMQRATSLSLKADPSPFVHRSRSEVGKDLERFFGKPVKV
ncbi:MAG: PilZ domain-containing protein [Magnetococcales bacterium]|nr:PilZ domain-containing protein [Magnetococcales bacterium]MBF0440099.1 PilZ domain-containing protein [Magnetococcales bacterium]